MWMMRGIGRGGGRGGLCRLRGQWRGGRGRRRGLWLLPSTGLSCCGAEDERERKGLRGEDGCSAGLLLSGGGGENPFSYLCSAYPRS